MKANGFDCSPEWHSHAVFDKARSMLSESDKDVRLKLEAMSEIYNKMIDDLQSRAKTIDELEARIDTFDYVLKVKNDDQP